MKRHSQVNAANPYGDSSFHSDSSTVLSDAKRDLEKEIETWKTLKEQYSHSNTSVKAADEGEIDDTENAQDSVSEDDSDDDSDRKGMFRDTTSCYPIKQSTCTPHSSRKKFTRERKSRETFLSRCVLICIEISCK